VQRERARVSAAEEIAAARAAAERGAFEEAGTILQRQLCSLRRSRAMAVSQLGSDDDDEEEADDDEMLGLEEELVDFEDCMRNKAEYESTGRARVLNGISSHMQQRAAFVTTELRCGRRERAQQPYMTTAMESMLTKSRKSREKQRTPSPPPPTKRKRGGRDRSSTK
jgi:hypothetical protein